MNTEYFAPLLSVNQFGSSKILKEIPAGDMFAILSNWLLRPVPPVTNAVRRFKERYFEDNYVIGECLTSDTANRSWSTNRQMPCQCSRGVYTLKVVLFLPCAMLIAGTVCMLGNGCPLVSVMLTSDHCAITHRAQICGLDGKFTMPFDRLSPKVLDADS